MPDVFADINAVPADMIEVVANVLETRAAIASQQQMLKDYLFRISFPPQAHVLEVGCGTGPVCRVLSTWPNVKTVVGIDPSRALLAKARDLSPGLDNISYQEGDGKSLSFDDGTFDVVVLHTLLTHVPEPEKVLSEAARVLKSSGNLAICDGDFSTATLQTGPTDPLQVCTQAFVENFVHDKWLVRRMSALAQDAGFEVQPIRSYGLVETNSPGLTVKRHPELPPLRHEELPPPSG
jgi:arsenite methyltransferase